MVMFHLLMLNRLYPLNKELLQDQQSNEKFGARKKSTMQIKKNCLQVELIRLESRTYFRRNSVTTKIIKFMAKAGIYNEKYCAVRGCPVKEHTVEL